MQSPETGGQVCAKGNDKYGQRGNASQDRDHSSQADNQDPFNAAIFDINAAGRIIESYNHDRAWVGGHSLGGITACRFTGSNPKRWLRAFPVRFILRPGSEHF